MLVISKKEVIMKKIFAILMILIMVFPACAFAETTFKYLKDSQKQLENIPSIGSKAVYIAEPTTGKVIYEKNAHEKMYPASTTKLLTALVVIENCDLDEKTVVSQHALDLVPDGYSNAKLKAGEELDIKTLLYALLVPSANEAANVLAEHVSGSVETFVEKCNQRAQELGCEMLHFVNANGIHDENHYCSAYDLYLIAKECKKHDIFNEIVKTNEFTLPATNVYAKADRTFKNTNELLLTGKYFYASCTGIKTGFTTPAGECMVGSAFKDGIELISVVLGGKANNNKGMNERFSDTKDLFEFTYDNYSMKTISNYGDVVATLNVGKATKNTASLELIVDDTIQTIVPNDIDKNNIFSTITINEDIVAPIEQNDVLGTITYYADGLVYTTNIIASHSVEKLPYWLYNTIIVIIIIITLLLFVKLHKKSKKKDRILVLFFIIAVIELCCGIMIKQEGEKNSITTAEVESNMQITKK